MDLNVPTIAQRKAARRSQASGNETDPTTTVPGPLPEPTVPVPPPSQSFNQNSSHLQLEKKPPVTPKLDKESLIALARTMGLELSTPKKIWIKHSYSVTPDSKDKFSKYCDVLGIKMQDGLEEALQDWFKKKENEFKAISDAKGS